MNFKQKNVASILVAKNVNRTGGITDGVRVTTALMADGEIVAVNPAGKAIDKDALSQRFRFVVETPAGELKFSDMIDAKQVNKVTCYRYAAPVDQVDYIGYNGTSGSIDVIDNNVYKVNIYLRGTTALDFSRMQVKHGVYKSDSAATQSEIAAGLTNSLITNFSREGSKLAENIDVIRFERINSGAVANALGTATVSVVNGSKAITFSEDMTALVTAGTILRIGGLGAGTTPCYIVASTDGGATTSRVYFLDIPWQGTTNTAVAANLVESVTEGNWGIKMTGSILPFQVWNKPYDRSTWTFGLQDFGSTTITNSTAMSLGSGYGKAVQELEAWISMNAGRQYLNATGVVYPTIDAVASGTYALIHFQYSDLYTTELGHQVNQHKELWLACPAGTATTYTSTGTSIGTVIDQYASTYSWDITRGTGTNGVANTTTAKAIESGAGA